MRAANKILVKICLIAIRDVFSYMWFVIGEGQRGLNFLVDERYPIEVERSKFWT